MISGRPQVKQHNSTGRPLPERHTIREMSSRHQHHPAASGRTDQPFRDLRPLQAKTRIRAMQENKA